MPLLHLDSLQGENVREEGVGVRGGWGVGWMECECEATPTCIVDYL